MGTAGAPDFGDRTPAAVVVAVGFGDTAPDAFDALVGDAAGFFAAGMGSDVLSGGGRWAVGTERR